MMTCRDGTTPAHVLRLLALYEELAAKPAGLSGEEIHRIRVGVKQTRAWLRFCRAVCGDTPAYRQLLEALRQLSHALSGQRDRDVAQQTLTRLVHKYPGHKSRQLLDTISQDISRVHAPAPDTVTLKRLSEQICLVLPNFIRLTIPHEAKIAVIERAWAKMCKQGENALKSKTCADLHAWRKRVKSLTYQLTMTVFTPQPSLQQTHARLNKLGKRLGELHDLCFVQSMVEDIAAAKRPPLDPAPLLKRIRREHKRLIVVSRKHYRHVCPPLSQRVITMVQEEGSLLSD